MTSKKHQLILIMAAALLPASHALADWTAIGEGGGANSNDYVAYVDFESAAKTDTTGTLWTIIDFKNAKSVSGKSVASTKTHFEFMCEDKKKRTLEFSWHSEKMGNGEVVMQKKEADNWKDFSADGLDEKRQEIACGKVKKTQSLKS